MENILLDSKGHSKIADFDQCQNLIYYRIDHCKNLNESNNKMPFEMKKFSKYIAPEGLTNGKIDYSFDFWSLGILMFKMLTGHFPFQDEESIKRDELPIMNDSSEHANHFVKNLLVKDKDKRYITQSDKSNNLYMKYHDFYLGIDWTKLENGESEPVFKPRIAKKENIPNTSNFRKEKKPKQIDLNGLDMHDRINEYDEHLSQEFQYMDKPEFDRIDLLKKLSEGSFGKVRFFNNN